MPSIWRQLFRIGFLGLVRIIQLRLLSYAVVQAFVCQNEQDRDELLREMHDRQKLMINATFVPEKAVINRPNIEPLKKYGITWYPTLLIIYRVFLFDPIKLPR